jgi:hypothetical protein
VGKLLRAIVGLSLVAAPLLFATNASAGTTTATAILDCWPGPHEFSAHVDLQSVLPETVAQGNKIPFDVTANDFFQTPAPYSGTVTVTETFAVSSGASPAGAFTLTTGPVHFNTGDLVPGFGTTYAEHTAAGSPGTAVQYTFTGLQVLLAPDGGAAVGYGCTPASPVALGQTKIVSAVSDTTAPTCSLTSKSSTGIGVTTRDTVSGVKTIEVVTATNAKVSIPAFSAGTVLPLVVNATKINAAQPSQVGLRVTDVKGNVITCDPILTSLVRERRPQVFENVDGSEHYLQIANGNPGLRRVIVHVGKVAYRVDVASGETKTIDLRSMRADRSYAVRLRGVGAGSADVLIWDGR